MGNKHHWIPATYIARFSADITPSRTSQVHVYEFERDRHFVASVDKIAAERDFYTLREGRRKDPEMLEKLWASYETSLGPTLDRLISNDVDAVEWLHVLVPFVASLLVRGPDFDERNHGRLVKSLGREFVEEHVGVDNTNVVRLAELQRLMTAIIMGHWVVAETDESDPIVLNEKGWTPCLLLADQQTGELTSVLGIPLSRTHILHIHPRKGGPILHLRDGRWCPEIAYQRLVPGSVASQRQGAALTAARFMIGATREAVTLDENDRKVLAESGSRPPFEPYWFPGFPTLYELIAHEHAWHRLASALTHAPDSQHWDFAIDLDRLVRSRRWMLPSISVPFGNPIMPPCFVRDGDVILGLLYAVPGITSPSDRGNVGETFRYDNGHPYPFLFQPDGENDERWPERHGHKWHHTTMLHRVDVGEASWTGSDYNTPANDPGDSGAKS